MNWSGMPGYRYTLRDQNGDDAGEVEIAYTPKAGEELILSGNRRVTVTAVIPVELAAEFVDDASFGVLEIELTAVS